MVEFRPLVLDAAGKRYLLRPSGMSGNFGGGGKTRMFYSGFRLPGELEQSFANSPFLGSAANLSLSRPIVGVAQVPAG